MVLTTLGPVTMVFAMSNNLAAHFKYLQDHFRSIEFKHSLEREKLEIKNCIVLHQRIINWVEELNDICSPISNAMSVYYAILICTTGFQIVVVS
jgi:hypothetical protein